jgi:hypothetical protein
VLPTKLVKSKATMKDAIKMLLTLVTLSSSQGTSTFSPRCFSAPWTMLFPFCSYPLTLFPNVIP